MSPERRAALAKLADSWIARHNERPLEGGRVDALTAGEALREALNAAGPVLDDGLLAALTSELDMALASSRPEVLRRVRWLRDEWHALNETLGRLQRELVDELAKVRVACDFALKWIGTGDRALDFERAAEAFWNDTGMMAPGRNMPLDMARDDDEKRRQTWIQWMAEQRVELRKRLAEAVSSASKAELGVRAIAIPLVNRKGK